MQLKTRYKEKERILKTCTSRIGTNAGFKDLLLPGGSKDFLRLVVTSEAVDSALDQNQTELAVLVL